MGKTDKFREGDDRRVKHKKNHDKGSGGEYSNDERSERRRREKEDKKVRRRKEKEAGGEHGGRERSRERYLPTDSTTGPGYPPGDPFGYAAAQGQAYQPPPVGPQYGAQQGYGYQGEGVQYPGSHSPSYGAGVYASGGAYQSPPPPHGPPPPIPPGYGSFQGPPVSLGNPPGGFQGYPPPPPQAPHAPPGPPPPPATQPYGAYGGPYGYPPPQQQQQGAYVQTGYPPLSNPPPHYPAGSQGYPSYASPPPPPPPVPYSVGGAAGGKHYKPQHHSAQQHQAYYGQEPGSAAYPVSESPAVEFENNNPANPHSKPCVGSGKLGASALTTFTGALSNSLHSYARTLFPATSTHKPVAPYGTPGEGQAPDQRTGNRFDSFASCRGGNGVKWYVDGKDYMYAVSIAIENARESIWILDWWLSPELYLRRPPKLNEKYRIDHMLEAAAKRGVKINVIVYKEVTQALTQTKSCISRSYAAGGVTIAVSSHHTKTSLEKLHPNITVFRHPDHLPDRPTVQSDVWSKVTSGSYQLGDGLKGLYGMKDGITMYWAHHEKLCLVDGEIAFMGGLDLCFGRWDMNHHPIADAHPSDLRTIIFPGQDYNNARFKDFHTVDQWDQNKVSRVEHSRMGWSDVALSLIGPSVRDLQRHFLERWNFIYYGKYQVRKQDRFQPLDEHILHERGHYRSKVKDKVHHIGKKILVGGEYDYSEPGRDPYDEEDRGYGESKYDIEGVSCQIVRSSAKWSHGLPATEHSIAHAYIEIISAAQHFVYIENQFFITATDDKQSPILNKIGKAIVDRILLAARRGENFKMIIVIPALPGFAGDLKVDGSLGTRAIMEFQYRSINNDRGYSIMEKIAKAGVDPTRYIRFYNLRNYDRINAGRAMSVGEQHSGVGYPAAAEAHDQQVGGAYGGGGYGGIRGDEYETYQRAAPPSRIGSEWDSVSQCCMLGGGDIRSAPWDGTPEAELDSYVSEELYVHSKLLIADDRIVICGSANLNDRSQLGDHDSEIAIIIEDPTPLPSRMDSRDYQASHFAATLRRQIFRKHLGLIPAANLHTLDENMQPVPIPNIYDFDSGEDRLVTDPLSPSFQSFWNDTARRNTQAFEKVFHTVPTDLCKNWKDYDEYWGRHFRTATKEGKEVPPKVRWGHVVREGFSADARTAVQEVKNVLSSVRGHLVEMPLEFLKEEDIAKEGLGLNALTEPIYT